MPTPREERAMTKRSYITVTGLVAFGGMAGAVVADSARSRATWGQDPTAAPIAVSMTVDASQRKGPLAPIYRFFGADEPNYTYMEDGLALLREIGRLGAPQEFFRAHSMMVSGDGTPALKWGSTNMYREDAQGRPIYDWTIVDRIFDALLKNGVKPYVQIGFMPEALSIRPDPYRHYWKPGDPYNDIYTGWTYPPSDYDKWRELVFQWVKHSVETYGRREVEQWYWQTWNEPNIGYWRGTREEFFKLHDYAIDGVRRALPTAKVGGPDTAGSGGAWTRAFLEHSLRGTNAATGQTGTPLDFFSFHAKGAPTVFQGHVRMGIANQLRAIDDGFGLLASFPELKDKPIVIGESDPDGCAACAATVYPQNAYRNTELYASYTAASFARKHLLAERHGVRLEGALTWAFEFEDQRMFAGFRVMATEGAITLPVFNVFRMFSRMSGQRVAVTSTGEVALDEILTSGVRAQPDVAALAAIDERRLYLFAWHYHDDEVPGPSAKVEVSLTGLPATRPMQMVQYRVDRDHSNAHTAWQRMGSPAQPTSAQMATLRLASQLQTMGAEVSVPVDKGRASLQLELPRQGVSLSVLSW
jgi:xylan 1,4-beta-xylosidase